MFSRNMYCNFSYLFGVMWGLSTDYKIYGVPVLNYHQVNDEKHSALTLHVDQFREQSGIYT